jgi:hypothetical protein
LDALWFWTTYVYWIKFSLFEQRVLLAMFLKRYTWILVANSEHENGLKNASGGGIELLGPEYLQVQFTKH